MCSHGTIGMPVSQGVQAQRPTPCKWDQAITEAKTKIKRLQYTIKVFKELRDSGEPWPGGSCAD
jgi:hypothetical protein